MRWTPVTLSRRMGKDADRPGGVDLWLPWPEGLPPGPPLEEGQDRPAAPEEHAAAEQILGATCQEHGLIPGRSYVGARRRHRAGQVEQYLVAWICGYRWVHARGPGAQQARDRWAPVERITRVD